MTSNTGRGGSYIVKNGKTIRNDELSTAVGEYSATNISAPKKPSKAALKEVKNADK